MKSFVEPLLHVKPETPGQTRPIMGTVHTAPDPLPTVDLSATEYRMLLHCRRPEFDTPEPTHQDGQTQITTNQKKNSNTRRRR